MRVLILIVRHTWLECVSAGGIDSPSRLSPQDRISYSFYLLHPLGILFAFRIFDPASLNASGIQLSLNIVLIPAP